MWNRSRPGGAVVPGEQTGTTAEVKNSRGASQRSVNLGTQRIDQG